MRHSKALLVLLVASAPLIWAACGGDNASPEPRTLHFFNWEDYVDPSVIASFEQESGIDVTLDYYGDEQQLIASISSDPGKYDLFVGTDSLLAEMAELDLLAQLDRGNIPNLENIDPRFLNLPGDPDTRYGVPYDWGTTGIMYNKNCVQPADASWTLLSDPRFAGRIILDSDPSVVIAMTLKSLGYSLSSNDESELQEAANVIKYQVDDLDVRFMESYDMREAMTSSDAFCLAEMYNGSAATDMADNPQLGFFVPREGADIYVDMLAIPREAGNKEEAELFINYILRPDIHAAINSYTGYASPNREAIEQGLVDGTDNIVAYPDTTNLEPWTPFAPERRARWNQLWAGVQAPSASSGSSD